MAYLWLFLVITAAQHAQSFQRIAPLVVQLILGQLSEIHALRFQAILITAWLWQFNAITVVRLVMVLVRPIVSRAVWQISGIFLETHALRFQAILTMAWLWLFLVITAARLVLWLRRIAQLAVVPLTGFFQETHAL
jgi:hypothetical protein